MVALLLLALILQPFFPPVSPCWILEYSPYITFILPSRFERITPLRDIRSWVVSIPEIHREVSVKISYQILEMFYLWNIPISIIDICEIFRPKGARRLFPFRYCVQVILKVNIRYLLHCNMYWYQWYRCWGCIRLWVNVFIQIKWKIASKS